jgi:hypothetical protein
MGFWKVRCVSRTFMPSNRMSVRASAVILLVDGSSVCGFLNTIAPHVIPTGVSLIRNSLNSGAVVVRPRPDVLVVLQAGWLGGLDVLTDENGEAARCGSIQNFSG